MRLANDDGRLLIVADDGEQRWPLADVVLNSRLGNTPRVLRLPDGGQVEVPDDPLLARWFPRPRSRVEAAADWLERRRAAIAVAALGTALLVVGFFHYGVPAIAKQVAGHLPRALEVAASDQAMALLRRMGASDSKLPEDRKAALQAAFAQLVAGEPRERQLRLAFVDTPAFGPNAFALPDGRVFLTDQLVKLDGVDDDALIAVLAHEAGHHAHHHGMRAAIEGSSVFVVLGLLVGDASGSSLVAALPSALLTSGFSRRHEREADEHAFDLLERRGRSPAAFARAMEALMAAHGEDCDPTSGWLSTHPQSRARIEAARARAGNN